MDKNFKELVEYLDKKFAKLDSDIANLQGRTENIEEQMGKIEGQMGRMATEIVNLGERTERIEERMATKIEVGKLLDAIDAYLKQGENYRQEMVALFHKIDRHEKWILQIAEKAGLKLEY